MVHTIMRLNSFRVVETVQIACWGASNPQPGLLALTLPNAPLVELLRSPAGADRWEN